jgi:hypothetical protein
MPVLGRVDCGVDQFLHDDQRPRIRGVPGLRRQLLDRRELGESRGGEDAVISFWAPRCVGKAGLRISICWRLASLVTTDTQGNVLTMPDNVRFFFLSYLQHYVLAGDKSELTRTCAYPTNPLNAGSFVRALLVALDAWISNGTVPPASRYPSRSDGTLGRAHA